MFTVLIESEQGPARRGGWLTGSAVVHGAIIAAAIAATVHPLTAGPDPLPPPRSLIFTRPAPAPPSAPRVSAVPASRGSVVPTDAPLPRFDVAVPAIAFADPRMPSSLDPQALLRHAFRPPGDAPGDRGDPSGGGGVLRPGQVDRTVIAHASNGAPRYPATLRAAGVEGEVLVQFVVDTLGRVERESITILRAAHGAFADAVIAWLSRNRYTPAEVGGRAVRQLVEQRVDFNLQRR